MKNHALYLRNPTSGLRKTTRILSFSGATWSRSSTMLLLSGITVLSGWEARQWRHSFQQCESSTHRSRVFEIVQNWNPLEHFSGSYRAVACWLNWHGYMKRRRSGRSWWRWTIKISKVCLKNKLSAHKKAECWWSPARFCFATEWKREVSLSRFLSFFFNQSISFGLVPVVQWGGATPFSWEWFDIWSVFPSCRSESVGRIKIPVCTVRRATREWKQTEETLGEKRGRNKRIGTGYKHLASQISHHGTATLTANVQKHFPSLAARRPAAPHFGKDTLFVCLQSLVNVLSLSPIPGPASIHQREKDSTHLRKLRASYSVSSSSLSMASISTESS